MPNSQDIIKININNLTPGHSYEVFFEASCSQENILLDKNYLSFTASQFSKYIPLIAVKSTTIEIFLISLKIYNVTNNTIVEDKIFVKCKDYDSNCIFQVTPSPTNTPTPTLTRTPTITPTTSITPTITPTTSITPTPTPTSTPEITPSKTFTPQPSPTTTPSYSPTTTPSYTPGCLPDYPPFYPVCSSPSNCIYLIDTYENGCPKNYGCGCLDGEDCNPSNCPTPTPSVTPTVTPTVFVTPTVTPTQGCTGTCSWSCTGGSWVIDLSLTNCYEPCSCGPIPLNPVPVEWVCGNIYTTNCGSSGELEP